MARASRGSFSHRGTTGVERVAVLDEDHPLFDQPTTGVFDGRTFYYVANSQFTKFDESFQLAPRATLVNPVVLRLLIGEGAE